jgi:hypothetical protein
VERVAGLVQERLVVVEAALGARDQVDDARGIGCDHTGAWRLLRAVVQVEADARHLVQVEPDRRQRGDADLDGALLRVRLLERREPAQIARVVRARHLVALRAEQLLEPALAQSVVGACGRTGGRGERTLELLERDPLLLGVARDRVGLAGQLRLQRLARREQLPPVVVEARVRRVRERAELVAIGVAGEDGEPRLRRSQRQLLAAPIDARRQDPVLELVLARGQLPGDQPGLARLAQAIQELALLGLGACLGVAQHVELRRREEVAVALDDRGLLGGLLLPHPNRAALLGALEQVAREALLVLRWCPHRCDAHVLDLI